jgi:glycopeptide antibiotics resistance protein
MLLKPGAENKEYWFMFQGIDKLIHLSIFAFLGFCFKTAFPKSSLSYYILIILSYGILTEILQEMMHWGRSMEALDVLADLLGLLLGYIIYRYISKLFS